MQNSILRKKLSYRNESDIKTLTNERKQKVFIVSRPELRELLKEVPQRGKKMITEENWMVG